MKHITNIFLNADANKSNITTDFLTVNSNIYTSNIHVSNLYFSNVISQIGTGDNFFRGSLNIGLSTERNRNLFVGGSVRSSSNIVADSNLITSNINSINII